MASSIPLTAQWPTTVDSAIFVDYGLYPYLVVDEEEQSVIVIYIANADQMKAKKYDRYGYPVWGGNSVLLTEASHMFGLNLSNLGNQWGAVVSDDSGGAVICWKDYRNSTFDWMGFPENNEIYIQRVDASGEVRFGTNGIRISSEASSGWHKLGDMKPDYNGGFVVGYSDFDSSRSYCRRIELNGDSLWENTYDGGYLDINATDVSGNVFISFGANIKRQKLDLEGNHLWSDTLLGRIPDSREYRHGGAFSDGNGGVIGVGPSVLLVNRVDSSGQYVFGENGIDLGFGQQGLIGYASDYSGGIYVSWTSGASRIQRVNKDGVIVFDPDGIKVAQDSAQNSDNAQKGEQRISGRLSDR
ncbi:MAG: hypothetical protein ACE5EE_07325 [Fidelibacterota bacterium]